MKHVAQSSMKKKGSSFFLFYFIHLSQMSWKETVNKPAAKPAVAPKPKFNTKDDDWDTDPSYQV